MVGRGFGSRIYDYSGNCLIVGGICYVEHDMDEMLQSQITVASDGKLTGIILALCEATERVIELLSYAM